MLKTQDDSADMTERWTAYDAHCAVPGPDYRYPVTTEQRDSSILVQDPKHGNAEEELIAELLEGDWRVAMDFGCGDGEHLGFFDRAHDRDKLVIGIEPDASRAQNAQKRLEKTVTHARGIVRHGDAALLEDAARQGLRVDRILCGHYFGTLRSSERARTIRALRDILNPDGACLLLAPVAGAAFCDNTAHAGNWDGASDYYHVVNKGVAPPDFDYRTHVTRDAFDEAVDSSKPGFLPVCCYFLPDFPSPANTDTPHPLSVVPPTLASLLDDFFDIEDIQLFTIHRDAPHLHWPVGSVSLRLRPKTA